MEQFKGLVNVDAELKQFTDEYKGEDLSAEIGDEWKEVQSDEV